MCRISTVQLSQLPHGIAYPTSRSSLDWQNYTAYKQCYNPKYMRTVILLKNSYPKSLSDRLCSRYIYKTIDRSNYTSTNSKISGVIIFHKTHHEPVTALERSRYATPKFYILTHVFWYPDQSED